MVACVEKKPKRIRRLRRGDSLSFKICHILSSVRFRCRSIVYNVIIIFISGESQRDFFFSTSD